MAIKYNTSILVFTFPGGDFLLLWPTLKNVKAVIFVSNFTQAHAISDTSFVFMRVNNFIFAFLVITVRRAAINVHASFNRFKLFHLVTNFDVCNTLSSKSLSYFNDALKSNIHEHEGQESCYVFVHS